MSEPPPVERVEADVLLPRRTAVVPLLPDDGVDEDVEPPLRAVAPPEDEEPELPEEPEEDEPDPLEGGAERTGCCPEYAGAV